VAKVTLYRKWAKNVSSNKRQHLVLAGPAHVPNAVNRVQWIVEAAFLGVMLQGEDDRVGEPEPSDETECDHAVPSRRFVNVKNPARVEQLQIQNCCVTYRPCSHVTENCSGESRSEQRTGYHNNEQAAM